jgi:Tfp pilus assembly protein PilO
MAQTEALTKRVAISKANTQMVAILAVASFITVFCLIASKTMFGQISYQNKVVSAKNKASLQLRKNLEAFDSLVTSYKSFDGASTNVIGGQKDGSGDNDGSNSKIVLDSLPSIYDFPALTSSIEKIISDNGLKADSVTGADDQLNQQSNLNSPEPKPVDIPFSFSIKSADYSSVQRLVTALQRSARPIVVDSIEITGGQSNMAMTVNAHTFYQPGKSVNVKSEVVK